MKLMLGITFDDVVFWKSLRSLDAFLVMDDIVSRLKFFVVTAFLGPVNFFMCELKWRWYVIMGLM